MNVKFKWLAVIIIWNLSACSDNVPTTIPLSASETLLTTNQAAKLHLDVLSSPEDSNSIFYSHRCSRWGLFLFHKIPSKEN